MMSDVTELDTVSWAHMYQKIYIENYTIHIVEYSIVYKVDTNMFLDIKGRHTDNSI